MFQCADCGSNNPYHVCPKHPTFKIQEPGVVMTPRSIQGLEKENAKLLLQNGELQKESEKFQGIAGEAMKDLVDVKVVLKALADRMVERFGETIKHEPNATGKFLDAAYAILGKTEKRKDEAGNPWAPNKDYPGKPIF
jgi:hypothetical protein